VVVSAVPHIRPDALSLEQDSPWLAELRGLAEASGDLPMGARDAVRQVVESILLDGCTPHDRAEARMLLKRL
jgi:hypothetical protein